MMMVWRYRCWVKGSTEKQARTALTEPTERYKLRKEITMQF